MDNLDKIIDRFAGLNQHQEYIVNGFPATEGQFPHQVSILRADNDEPDRVHVGAGVIISSEWILTAAHVVKPSESYTIRFGSKNLWMGGEVQNATYAIIHPEYNETTLNNNVALVKIPNPLTLSAGGLRAIRLHRNEDSSEEEDRLVGVRSRIAGWGLNADNKISDNLNFVDLQIIDNFSCASTFGTSRIVDHVVCGIGWSNRNQNTCGGDSGGGLLIRQNDQWVHAGIAAFGAKACARGHPAGFMRTAHFYEWISQNVDLPEN